MSDADAGSTGKVRVITNILGDDDGSHLQTIEEGGPLDGEWIHEVGDNKKYRFKKPKKVLLGY